MKRKPRPKRSGTGIARRRSAGVKGRSVKLGKGGARTHGVRAKSRMAQRKLRLGRGVAGRRGRVKRKRSSISAAYQSALNQSYNSGYNAAFAKGFEEGHQLAYEQQI